jgi:hypothetical protein
MKIKKKRPFNVVVDSKIKKNSFEKKKNYHRFRREPRKKRKEKENRITRKNISKKNYFFVLFF